MAWWDGAGVPHNGQLPHPYVEDIEILPDWSNFINVHFSMRINRRSLWGASGTRAVNQKLKKTFKFLSDTIPNPQSVFYIKGKKYLCEKITATFTENGMSQLLKGIFWPIVD